LDHGILSGADPQRLQALGGEDRRLAGEKGGADGLTPSDPEAGYRYDLSLRQAEFSLPPVWDRPAQGRIFFEAVMRDNLDLGRPDQVPGIFGRRVTRATLGRFRTRVIPQGVSPSLAVDYKTSRLPQDPQEARALRTETTINNLTSLPAASGWVICRVCDRSAFKPTDVGSKSNASATMAPGAKKPVNRPREVNGQRASALRFTDLRVLTLA
jgi:hypothetical protein